MLTGLDFSADLVRQMAKFGEANASTTSTEEFRQKMAEVERMLREMKERNLGSQEELARREHEEAQKCESSSEAQDRAVQTLLGLVVPDSLVWSPCRHYTSWSCLEDVVIQTDTPNKYHSNFCVFCDTPRGSLFFYSPQNEFHSKLY